MNALTDTFKQIMERKLWPLVLLLVVALVAVPMLLSEDPEPASLPVPTAAVPAANTDEALVTVADGDKRDKVRAVLGDRKDPFRPAQVKRVKKADDLLAGNSGQATEVAGGSGGSSGSDAGSGGTAPVATATPAPPKTFELYSLKVRFGATDGALSTRNVKRLTGLPGGAHPAALYLGLLDDHKSAVFIIDAGVQVLGDGHCNPSPEDCQTLTMKKGETEFLTRGDKQYELDLVDINVKKTTDAGAAKASRTTVATGGRKTLKGLVSRVGALRYDESIGALKTIPKAEQAKRVAKTGRSASFTSTG